MAQVDPDAAVAIMLCHLAETGRSSELEQQLRSQSCWQETPSGTTPLMCAARAGARAAGNSQDCHATCAVLLLTEAGDRNDRKRMANAAGADGIGCLHLAAASDNASVAEKLLLAGAKVNARDSWGRSPLMFAVGRGKGRTAELLLRSGADPLQKDSTGQTPMQLARDLKNDVLEQLMQRWLPTNKMDKQFHEVNRTARQKLSEGQFSAVYSVQTVPPLPVVVRVLLQQGGNLTELVRAAETKILSALKMTKHKNIVQFLNYNDSSPACVLEIFLEKVEGRTLKKILESGPLPEDSIRNYAVQIANALSYLHSHPHGTMVHRDIQCDNIMVTGGGVVKLIDFGFAQAVANTSVIRTTTKIGSVSHMAPEIIAAERCSYSTYSDVWSFGCALYNMAMGEPPFKGHFFLVIRKILSVVPPIDPEKKFGAALQDLYNQCMQREPQDRISAVGIVLHGFCKLEVKTNLLPSHSRWQGTADLACVLSSVKDFVTTTWNSGAQDLIEGLQQIEDKIGEVAKDTTGKKLAETVLFFTGGLAVIAGSVVTAGLAVPVVIAGTALAAGGSIRSAWSENTKRVLDIDSHKEAVAKINKFKKTTETLYNKIVKDVCDIVRRKILTSSFCTATCDVDFQRVRKLLSRLSDEIRTKTLELFLNGCLGESDERTLKDKCKQWQLPIEETLRLVEEKCKTVQHLDVDSQPSDGFYDELAKAVEMFERMLRILLFGSADEPSEVFYQEVKSGLRILTGGVHAGSEAVGRSLQMALGIIGASVFTVADVGFLIYYSKQLHDLQQGQKDALAVQIESHKMHCQVQRKEMLKLADELANFQD